jgi:hypothetical protein
MASPIAAHHGRAAARCPRAVEGSVYIVRAFVRMRELATTHIWRNGSINSKTRPKPWRSSTTSSAAIPGSSSNSPLIPCLVTPPDPPKRPLDFVQPNEKSSEDKANYKRRCLTEGTELLCNPSASFGRCIFGGTAQILDALTLSSQCTISDVNRPVLAVLFNMAD